MIALVFFEAPPSEEITLGLGAIKTGNNLQKHSASERERIHSNPIWLLRWTCEPEIIWGDKPGVLVGECRSRCSFGSLQNPSLEFHCILCFFLNKLLNEVQWYQRKIMIAKWKEITIEVKKSITVKYEKVVRKVKLILIFVYILYIQYWFYLLCVKFNDFHWFLCVNLCTKSCFKSLKKQSSGAQERINPIYIDFTLGEWFQFTNISDPKQPSWRCKLLWDNFTPGPGTD